jgi:ribonuclease E
VPPAGAAPRAVLPERPKIGDTLPPGVLPPGVLKGRSTAGSGRPRAGGPEPAVATPPRVPVAGEVAEPAVATPPQVPVAGEVAEPAVATPPRVPVAGEVAEPAVATPPQVPVAGEVAASTRGDLGSQPGAGLARRRRTRRRRVRAAGRYLMCVHTRGDVTQVAILEGRSLVEHYVARASDDVMQIDGNIYRGRVQNVLPGMEAAFVDIGTPKNAVLYRGDVRYDPEDVEARGAQRPRIEEMLKPGQMIVCQVTKNPIGAKGARLTQEVSLPGRFVVMVPNSDTFGVSKRLDDAERRRLRRLVEQVRPEGHGFIVRTAAEGASAEELRLDMERLAAQWRDIEDAARRVSTPTLLYREPDLAVRLVREELSREYRAVVIDDLAIYDKVRSYVETFTPELAERVEYYDETAERLPLFERYHVHEQLHKALDRKVWLPSGGSIIIERTEALTVIDVNTGKNVGTSSLEETVFRNNLEAAEEIARQLRLRDIGGIIVIDFIDMDRHEHRQQVTQAFRAALARDRTRTQVLEISELGLVEMTRKRVSEGLVEALSTVCPTCEGRGLLLDDELLGKSRASSAAAGA